MAFVARLRRDPRGAVSLGFLAALTLLAVLAPAIAPYSPTTQNVADMLAEPSAAHWLGTDDLGRDVLSRLLHASGASLFASVLAVAVASAIGIPTGFVSGFVGGWIDEGISRVIDTLLSFPGIVLAVGVTGALGIGLTNGMIAVARQARGARVALVGHEPSMGQLLSDLVGRPGMSLVKAGVVKLSFEGAPSRGAAQLVWTLSPRNLVPQKGG